MENIDLKYILAFLVFCLFYFLSYRFTLYLISRYKKWKNRIAVKKAMDDLSVFGTGVVIVDKNGRKKHVKLSEFYK